MNCNCFILVLVSLGATVSAVDYEELAKKIFANFEIGSVHVGDLDFDSTFGFQHQEYELKIKDAVIRRFEPDRLGLSYVSGVPTRILEKRLISVNLLPGTLTMDCKLVYNKKGSSESPKELDLVLRTEESGEEVVAIITQFKVNLNERKVENVNSIRALTMGYVATSNCNEQAPGFCDDLHDFVSTSFNFVNHRQVNSKLAMQVEQRLTAKHY